MVFKMTKLIKETPMDMWDEVNSFYSALKPFKWNKTISRGYWGWKIFLFGKGEGVNLIN